MQWTNVLHFPRGELFSFVVEMQQWPIAFLLVWMGLKGLWLGGQGSSLPLRGSKSYDFIDKNYEGLVGIGTYVTLCHECGRGVAIIFFVTCVWDWLILFLSFLLRITRAFWYKKNQLYFAPTTGLPSTPPPAPTPKKTPGRCICLKPVPT